MESLLITATDSTPEINFDLESNCLKIEGESYPENTTQFYGPVFTWLREYLSQLDY